MKNTDQIILEKIYQTIFESSTRVSESEIQFYFDEIFENQADDLKFSKPDRKFNHPKFDNIIFSFPYKGTKYVKVFSNPGEGSSKSDSGSLLVSIFISEIENMSKYYKKESNAFYNEQTKRVDYDPIINNGKDLLIYVKSVLDRDDRDKDYNHKPQPTKPKTKLKPVMA